MGNTARNLFIYPKARTVYSYFSMFIWYFISSLGFIVFISVFIYLIILTGVGADNFRGVGFSLSFFFCIQGLINLLIFELKWYKVISVTQICSGNINAFILCLSIDQILV